ncbi:hydantoinase/oxoprolinase family protein [Sulfitobacter sp. JBTF-M27]|uniref:Hydantoinase/oxoprolinase family protein n=1 Tax=Sulfitobacter sediminilitoris TaxID=2698830 RepID=A0A6P0CE33_9RHOB|nr:hydantoinase/oxoprolinase family protein [Sulfitobacter sediminilitoris]NEK23458.1 hydantoinase/oxoprolinase family protein [Sulfitobacter sediminilitoris]
MIRVGVDVGGTFTDIVLERTRVAGEDDQQVVVTKVPSTPHDQSEGVVAGVLQVCKQAGVAPGEIDVLFHGTTVATNMVIERNGAEVGMLTTRGFRDILHMARHKRPHNFSLQFDVPWQSKPLVKRRNRLPISERLMPPTGEVDVPMDEGEVREAAELLKKRGVDAVIVGFLFSFLNDTHEKRAVEILREVMPDAFICASSEVVNVIREYERFSSTAMNAYIGPKTARYLNSLETRLRDNGVQCPVRIMQSNGGISTVAQSATHPIGLLLSGPAGGVIGGRWTGGHCDTGNVITIDIGGTSADISVIQNGELRIKNPRDTEVAGLPVLAPMIDIDAIGAGGGSIAYIDEGGAFRVGPRSAGAVPGPACYGQGGTEPTVTDAQVALGRLDPERFLGGDLSIDRGLAEKAIKVHIADPLGMSVTEAALGILKIINNNMALAINANSVAKGIDPRTFSLMGFGGAGPLHAVALGEMIQAEAVISPLQPGITAAMGLLVTDLKYEYTRSVLQTLDDADDDALARINAIADELVAEADAQLDADGIPADARTYTKVMECRYLGQGFELRAEMPHAALTEENKHKVIDSFFDVHKEAYGHAFRDQITEGVTLRVIAGAEVDQLRLSNLDHGGREDPHAALLYTNDTVFDDGHPTPTPRYDREKLLAEDRVNGPAIITQHNSTTIVPPGYVATVLGHGDIRITRT